MNYEKAFSQKIDEEIVGLTQGQFLAGHQIEKEWSIGPFELNPQLTFSKTTQMADPTNIGWTSSSIFNPSVLVENEDIYLFFRAAVKKESLGSRIGLATYRKNSGWTINESNPTVFPTELDEILSVEDPKVYRFNDESTGKSQYVLFYNGIWDASEDDIKSYEKPNGSVACNIKYAFSDDLISWHKAGLVVPYEISRLWAKGAVIPRDGAGNAVRIDGKYLMFISEGCGNKQIVGSSLNMRDWTFAEVNYLPLPPELGTHIYEVACAIVDGENLILDFMYSDHAGIHTGAQVLYKLDNPYQVLDYATGATLSWGGMSKYQDKWIFAQGWDAAKGAEEIFFYESKI